MSFKSRRRPVVPILHYFSRYFYGVTSDLNRAMVRWKWAVFDFFPPWCPSDCVQHRRSLSSGIWWFATFLKCLPSHDPTIHYVFVKPEKNQPWLTIIPFKICLESFPIQKPFIFLLFFSLYKWQKSLSRTTLMSLNWKNMDQTMPTIILISWSKLLVARLRYQQEFAGNLLLPNRCSIFFSMTNFKRYSEQMKINKCWLSVYCLFLSLAHDGNKGKTKKVSKGLSVGKNFTIMHMPQFFQLMLLNSKFLH